MNKLKVKPLDNPSLINKALTLMPNGYLSTSSEQLTYLDVDDDYIHQLLPLLKNRRIKRPNYFGEELIGAHISVIYPEENVWINPEDLGYEHYFTIKELFTAELDIKKYYVLMVESPSLILLRKKYGLGDMPYFRGNLINLHITIGVYSRCVRHRL